MCTGSSQVRPIVSGRSGLTELASALLDNLLQPFVSACLQILSNSIQLINTLSTTRLPKMPSCSPWTLRAYTQAFHKWKKSTSSYAGSMMAHVLLPYAQAAVEVSTSVAPIIGSVIGRYLKYLYRISLLSQPIIHDIFSFLIFLIMNLYILFFHSRRFLSFFYSQWLCFFSPEKKKKLNWPGIEPTASRSRARGATSHTTP